MSYLYFIFYFIYVLSSVLHTSKSQGESIEEKLEEELDEYQNTFFVDIVNSQCLTVSGEINFNLSVANEFLFGDDISGKSALDIDAVSSKCVNNTYITLSQPINPASVFLFHKPDSYYTGIEIKFHISAQISLGKTREFLEQPEALFAPIHSPELKVKLVVRNLTNVCAPIRQDNSSIDVFRDEVIQDLKQDLHDQSFNWSYGLTLDSPGIYYVIAWMSYNTVDEFYNSTISTFRKWDTPQFIEFEPFPDIKTVTTAAEAFSYIIITIIALIEVGLLFFTVKYRKTRVMQLSQGTFLIVFLVAAVVTTCSCVLYNSKTPTYCNLRGFFIFIPLQLLISILCGRLWRITAIMGPLVNWNMGNTKREPFFYERYLTKMVHRTKFQEFINKISGRNNSIKRKITNLQTWTKITLAVFPQVLLQIISISMYHQHISIFWNENNTVGIVQCESENGDAGEIIFWMAVAWLFLILFMSLWFAARSHSLPSLFDEAYATYSSVILIIFLLLTSILISQATRAPEISPDVGYLTLVLSTCTITITPSWKIIVPKLRLIFGGEHITLNSLLTEHRQHLQEKKIRKDRKSLQNQKKHSNTNQQKHQTQQEVYTGEKFGGNEHEITSKEELPENNNTTVSSTKTKEFMTQVSFLQKSNEDAELLPTMLKTITILTNLSQHYLNGLEVEEAEIEELKSSITLLNNVLATRKQPLAYLENGKNGAS